MTKQFKQITKLVVLTLGVVGVPQMAQATLQPYVSGGNALEYYDPLAIGAIALVGGTIAANAVVPNLIKGLQGDEPAFEYYMKKIFTNSIMVGSTGAIYSGLHAIVSRLRNTGPQPTVISTSAPTQAIPQATIIQPEINAGIITQSAVYSQPVVAQTTARFTMPALPTWGQVGSAIKQGAASTASAGKNMVVNSWNSLSPQTKKATIATGAIATVASGLYIYRNYAAHKRAQQLAQEQAQLITEKVDRLRVRLTQARLAHFRDNLERVRAQEENRRLSI